MLPFGSNFPVILGAAFGGRLSAESSQCDGSGILLSRRSFDRAFFLRHEANVSGIACCFNCVTFKWETHKAMRIAQGDLFTEDGRSRSEIEYVHISSEHAHYQKELSIRNICFAETC
jgi:hypothetical protein